MNRSMPLTLSRPLLMMPLLMLMMCGTTAVAGPEVALTIRNHTGHALATAPVRGGVPFALGHWHGSDTARLTDAQGRPVPCRSRPIARWHDGSVKWLLVETQVDLPPAATAKLTLAADPKTPPVERKLAVTDQPHGITIDTGPAQFAFSKQSFGAPAAAWADLDADGSWDTQVASSPGAFICEVEHQKPGEPQEENWLRDAAGGPREKFFADSTGDYRCTIETADDLRAVVKLTGWLVNAEGRRLVQYVIRAHACAGQPTLALQVTFVYAGKPKEDFIRSMFLTFPRASQGATRWAFGGETVHAGTLGERNDVVSLSSIGPEKIYHLSPYDQDKTVTYTVSREGKTLAEGKEPAGWASVADERGSLHLAVRDFWQMHPKEIRLRAGAAAVFLWPESGGKVLDLRRRYDEVENTYHYDLGAWPHGGEGVAVTHEVALRYGGAETPDAVGAALAARLGRPLVIQCDPGYVASTEAFGDFLPVDRERFPQWEALQDVRVAWVQRNQAQFHWDGMLDYGDTLFHGYATASHYGYIQPKGWCSRGYVGWLNDDGGLSNALFIQSLRSGDYETFLTAARMARHSMDVDTVHVCAGQPRAVGGGHRHDQQHWGNYVVGYGTATHGIIDLYLLTGDERARDVALETAGYHLAPTGEDEDMIGGLIRAWEITGDAKYKAAADQYVVRELARPDSSSWLFATRGHFRMVLNTSMGFMYYLSSAPPADAAKLRTAILGTMDANVDTCLSSWNDPWNFRPHLLFALACRLSGDKRHVDALAALLQRSTFPSAGEPVPPDFLHRLRTMPFGELPDVAMKTWGVNNIYSMQLEGFNALPYVMAALARGGLDEAGYRKVARVRTEVPPFEEILDPKRIEGPAKLQGRDSFLFGYTLEHAAPDDRQGRSKLLLYEDGMLLGPAHSGHRDIMTDGSGRWSHWGVQGVQFSTSDNTDPRTNGRRYKIVNPGP